jgi:hypothetical protein
VNFPLEGVQAGREGCVSLAQLDRAGWVFEVFLGPRVRFMMERWPPSQLGVKSCALVVSTEHVFV